jgi:hypothetical protein
MRAAKIIKQLAVCSSLFEWIESAAVQILKQGVSKQVLIFRDADDRGDGVKSSFLGRPPPAFTHDEFVSIFCRPDNNRLKHTDLSD